MTEFISYNSTQNITSFSQGLDYTATAINAGVGYDVFGVSILLVIFLGFYVIGSKYTQERALMFSTFMATVAAFILTSGHFLHPNWMLFTSFIFLITVFFGGSRTG